MSLFDEIAGLPPDFNNVVRLFPLPNLVMFPHVMQPFHIFEPRYRELLDDAIATDSLITLATLEPGWEADYEGHPPIAKTACLGRVINHARRPDGTHNILLLGLRRVQIVKELPSTRTFRLATAQVVEDIYPASFSAARPALHRQLLQCFRDSIPNSAATQEQFEQLVTQQIPLGVLTDIISFTLRLNRIAKQRLLADEVVDRRAQWLVKYLQESQHGHRDETDTTEHLSFPPPFSVN